MKVGHQGPDRRMSAEGRARELLAKMTVREKAGQLTQRLYGFSIYERTQGDELRLSGEFTREVLKYGGVGAIYGLHRADPWSGRNDDNGLPGILSIKARNQVQRYIVEHSRLGIPALFSSECPHGHQALGGYLLPVNLAVGAAFDPQLLERAYEVCGRQLAAMGIDLALISVLDVLRDPRWGRSEECYGEDPHLSAVLAKAAVTGMQRAGVYAVAKHFAAQGEGTGGINASAARIGERELREIHFPAMKACCDAGVRGVMAAYNEVDGVPCHANPWLLKDVLRQEMGFEGIVMSDGIAIDQLNVLTGDCMKSGALALKSGVDMGLWDQGFGLLEEALGQGLISEEELNRAALAILKMKFERGLFDQPYVEESHLWEGFDYEHYDEALQLARESAVLLKNDGGLLPLKLEAAKERAQNGMPTESGRKRLAVIGPNADDIYSQLGDYTPPVKDGVTVLEGIRRIMGERGLCSEVSYACGCGLFEGEEEDFREAVELAKRCDAAVLAVGGSSSRFGGASFDANGAAIADGRVSMDCGEGVDSGALLLPEIQRRLVREVCGVCSRVILVVIGGRPYVLKEEIQQAAAAVMAFYPGAMGGRAIAEILFGITPPSGRLPVSLPAHVGQLPVYYNPKASYQAMSYYDLERAPLFPFGFGLGYTQWEYGKISLEPCEITLKELKERDIIVAGSARNLGPFEAETVPMLMIRRGGGSVVPRVEELKAFTRIAAKPGQSVSFALRLSWESLLVWGREKEYVVESGGILLMLQDGGKEIWRGKLKCI